MIKDQRQLVGPRRHETVEQVKAAWQEHADDRARNGQPPFELGPGRTKPVESKAHVAAYVSDNRWVADCKGGPTGRCRGGIACWPDHDRGCCLDCGTVYTVDFPRSDEMEAALEALLVRPPEHRHWKPAEETAEQLRHENIQHGYMPGGVKADWRSELAAEHGVSVETVDAILARSEGGL